jgi:hypothetical protein
MRQSGTIYSTYKTIKMDKQLNAVDTDNSNFPTHGLIRGLKTN